VRKDVRQEHKINLREPCINLRVFVVLFFTAKCANLSAKNTK
jgi:hypothetical protein